MIVREKTAESEEAHRFPGRLPEGAQAPSHGRGRGVTSIVTSWPVRGSRMVMAASYAVGMKKTPDIEERSKCPSNMVSNSLPGRVISHLEM